MESLDHFTVECIVSSICTHCGPHPPLHECGCLDPHRNASCGLREEEAAGYVRTLAALSLTSKYFNSIATRHLYHRPTCKRWWVLARTLLERPDLAAHVRHLRSRNWYVADSSFTWGNLRGAVESHLKKQGRRLKDVRSGVGSALPLFISLCPGLQELDVDAMTDDDGGDMFRGFQPGSLNHLKSVMISPWDSASDYIGFDMACLAPLRTAAPNLERLAGWQLEESGACRRWPLANLKHLQLFDCTIALDYLHKLLAECPRLESFEYQSQANIQGEDIQVTPVGAQEALAKHAPGLKSLCLNFNDLDFEDSPSDEGWLVTSLTGLSKLEILQVDTRCLIPHSNPHLMPGEDVIRKLGDSALVDILPSSIRDLMIDRGPAGPDVVELVPSLSILAKAAREQFPALRRVVVRGKEAENVEACRPDFAAAGIQLRIDRRHLRGVDTS